MEAFLGVPFPLYVEFQDGFVGPNVFSLVCKQCRRWSSAVRCTGEPCVFENGLRMNLSFCGMELCLWITWNKSFIKVLLEDARKPLPEEKRNKLTGEIRQFLDTVLRLVSQELGQLLNTKFRFFVAEQNRSRCKTHGNYNCEDDDCVRLQPIGTGPGAMATASGDWCLENEVNNYR